MQQGIPTIGPRDIQFRSKIEAQWAYLFESMKLEWEYEPYELKYYIPDFIIKLHDFQILVEIKGDNDIWSSYEPHLEKIKKSGYNGRCIILGSTFKRCEEGYNIGIFANSEDNKITNAILSVKKCKCEEGTVSTMIWQENTHHGSYNEQPCGCSERGFSDNEDVFQKMWSIAKNLTQWKGKQNIYNKASKNMCKFCKINKIMADYSDECNICFLKSIDAYTDDEEIHGVE